jgi:hypothetical protein
MYCVIQKITKKKPNTNGAAKELKVTSFSFTNEFGREKTKYGYSYSYERFERPIRDAYKISIHKSYRENGEVKKKQWVICTMSYYDIVDFSLWDCAGFRITDKAEEIGIPEEELYKLIYAKFDPIEDQIEMEFQKTEEYKTKSKQDEILDKYHATKKEFNEKYTNPLFKDNPLFKQSETDEYDYCYDIFGVLRNPTYLKSLEDMKRWNDNAQRSYQSNKQSNYSNYDFSSYFKTNSSNYTDDEKVMLKKIYKVASKKFHPDVSGDDGSTMKFLTKLKEEWGI